MNEPQTDGHEAYEAPAIEQVLTADELERQVHYAGEGTPVPV